MTRSELVDGATDLGAIVVLGWIATATGADATTIVVAVAGIAGYRMRSRRQRSTE